MKIFTPEIHHNCLLFRMFNPPLEGAGGGIMQSFLLRQPLADTSRLRRTGSPKEKILALEKGTISFYKKALKEISNYLTLSNEMLS